MRVLLRNIPVLHSYSHCISFQPFFHIHVLHHFAVGGGAENIIKIFRIQSKQLVMFWEPWSGWGNPRPRPCPQALFRVHEVNPKP